MKPVVYQLMPRIFGNVNPQCVINGTIEQNGSGKFNDVNTEVLGRIKELGVTHIWYTGVLEHATRTDYSAHGIIPDNPHVVKGKAGSPYAIKDYYDVDPDLAVDVDRRLEEFDQLVKRTHDAGLKVIIDFVPNHTARNYHSDQRPAADDFGTSDDPTFYFRPANNYYYIPRQQFAARIDLGKDAEAYREFPAKATGNDCFTAFPGVCDWYDTVKLNYGVDYGDGSRHFDPVPDTWWKMLAILLHWVRRGVDGFRCDMVHMVPLEFWRWVLPRVRQERPSTIFIAEIYDVGLYRPFLEGDGFDYLYDKVNLYDTLRNILCHNHSAAQLTSCWQTVEGIGDRMLNFLENHDEQRFGSRFFAGDPKRAFAPMAVSALFNRGPFMLYMGQELGEQADDAEGFSGHDGRTTLFDYWSMPSMRRWLGSDHKPDDGRLTPQQRWLRRIYGRLLTLCNTEPAIAKGGFFDLMYVNTGHPRFNPHRHYAFLRHHDGEAILIVVNFGDSEDIIDVNIPSHAFDTMGIRPATTVDAIDLMTGRHVKTDFSPDVPVRVKVGAFGASIIKFPRR